MKKLFLVFILLVSCSNDDANTTPQIPDPGNSGLPLPSNYTTNVVSYDEDLMENSICFWRLWWYNKNNKYR